MARFRGFLDDFREMAANGFIGRHTKLQLSAETAVIGQQVNIQIDTPGRPVRLLIDGQHEALDENQNFQLFLVEDRPYQIEIFDEDGACLDRKVVQPTVAIPSLANHNLPLQVAYTEQTLQAALSFRNTETACILYRESQGNWSQLDNTSQFSITLPDTCGTIEFHIQLKSQHADMSERATVDIYKTIQVDHPEAKVSHIFSKGKLTVDRFSDVELELAARYVQSIRWCVGDEANSRVIVSPLNEEKMTLVVDTRSLGKKTVSYHYIDLHGEAHQQQVDVTVVARSADCKYDIDASGNVKYAIRGGNDISLEVPGRHLKCPTLPDQGMIQQGFLLPTLVIIRYVSDDGGEYSERLTLKAQPRWKA